MPEFQHKPVLLSEVLKLLAPREGAVMVDATIGGGSHGAEVLKLIGPGGVLIGIDRDPEAVDAARKRLAEFGERVRIVQGNFGDLASILALLGVHEIDGALFDFGVSSWQIDAEAGRGFSFSRDEPLSMKMDPAEDAPSAADIVNAYSEPDLANVIYEFGEERYSRRIARAIVERRKGSPITRTGELVDVIVSVVGRAYRGQDIHPATRTFQALRIETNHEFDAIRAGLPAAIEALKVGGRICAISFHSGEDAIVKSIFRRYAGRCECPPRLPQCMCGAKRTLEIITRRPCTVGPQELRDNPRSRSAKLRCAEKVG